MEDYKFVMKAWARAGPKANARAKARVRAKGQ
jgi:hypothetical protein